MFIDHMYISVFNLLLLCKMTKVVLGMISLE